MLTASFTALDPERTPKVGVALTRGSAYAVCAYRPKACNSVEWRPYRALALIEPKACVEKAPAGFGNSNARVGSPSKVEQSPKGSAHCWCFGPSLRASVKVRFRSSSIQVGGQPPEFQAEWGSPSTAYAAGAPAPHCLQRRTRTLAALSIFGWLRRCHSRATRR